MDPTVVELLQANAAHARAYRDRFDHVQDGQRPRAVTVTCSDARVMQDHLWGNDEPGRVFTVSNIGNRVLQRTDAGDVVAGDVLYPLAHTGTEVAVVVGHTGCGAVTAVHDDLAGDLGDEPAGIRHCVDVLRPGLEDAYRALPDDLPRSVAVDRLVERNVDRQVAALGASDDVPPEVTVVGVVYDFQDVYPGPRGLAHVVNVDGEDDADALRDAHPAVADRVHRLTEP